MSAVDAAAPAAKQTFRVEWSIEVDADTPEEAARLARGHQVATGTTATVFDVYDEGGECERVDLTAIDEERAEQYNAAIAAIKCVEGHNNDGDDVCTRCKRDLHDDSDE